MSENPHMICDDNIPIIVPRRIMVFAGHPDDELISCGGKILKYQNLGSEIKIIEGSVFVIVNIEDYWKKKKDIFNQVYTSQKEVLERVLYWAEDTAILRGNEINKGFGEAFMPETTYTPLKILLV